MIAPRLCTVTLPCEPQSPLVVSCLREGFYGGRDDSPIEGDLAEGVGHDVAELARQQGEMTAPLLSPFTYPLQP
jgi:hypothetical protein